MNWHPPTSAPTLFSRCCALLKAGDARAHEYLPLLEAHAGYSTGWCQLGETLLELDQASAAIQVFDRVIASDNTSARAKIGKAKGLLRQKDPASAERILACVSSTSTSQSERLQICRLRVRALYAAQRLQDSRRVAREGLAATPTDAELWFRFALASQDLSDTRVAIDGYQRALTIHPALFEASLNLGICLQEIGDISAAMHAYARAVDLSPPCFNRVAQALSSAPHGRLWLTSAGLRDALAQALIGTA